MYVNSATMINELYNEYTGKNDISTVDNSNIVRVGKEITNATSKDNLYGKIFTKVTETIVRNKVYAAKSAFGNLYRTGREYGDIIELLRVDNYVAEEDPSFKPTNGARYDDFLTYTSPTYSAKYVESKTGWQIKHWEPTYQLDTAFTSMEAADKFFGAIETAVINSINVRLEAMAKDALANMIGEVAFNRFPTNAGYAAASFANCVNLLKLYNDEVAPATALTAAKALTDPEFLRFAATKIMIDRLRIQSYSSLYNIDAVETFTRPEDIQLTLLNTFSTKLKTYLYSDTFNAEFLKLPGYSEVAFWQATGTTDFDSTKISSIDLKVEDPASTTPAEVQMSGILGVMYDKDAVIIYNESRPAGAFYHPDLQQVRVYNKFAAGFANLLDSNFIVYYIA